MSGCAVPRRMTRCECAEISFEAAAALGVRSLDELGEQTGCGRLCTACLPDLREFLAARSTPCDALWQDAGSSDRRELEGAT